MSTIKESRELTPEYLLSLGECNAEFAKILEKTPIPGIANLNTDVASLRAYLTNIRQQQNAAGAISGPKDCIEEDITISARDGYSIPIRIHRPTNPPQDGSPLFVVYHGGGFVIGGLDSEEVMCRQWVALGGVVVNVDYRLAPEHPFPVPGNDAYDALLWAASTTEKLKVNASKGFLVGGISAGANLASVAAQLYVDAGVQPRLTGTWLSIPPTLMPSVVPEEYKHLYLSREQNKNAPLLDIASMDFFEFHYKPKNDSPARSPFLFGASERAKLPPTYFQICGLDPLRDEGMIYEEVLRKAGVRTLLHVYPGLCHAFWTVCPQANFTKAFRQDCVEAMKWFLEGAGKP